MSLGIALNIGFLPISHQRKTVFKTNNRFLFFPGSGENPTLKIINIRSVFLPSQFNAETFNI